MMAMSIWIQHLVVLLMAGVAVWIIARQAFGALRGRSTQLAGCGGCKGCSTVPPAADSNRPPKVRIVFLPSESIGIHKSR
jgi:hypothetical protein